VPLLLRRKKEQEGNEGEDGGREILHQLVGECYVHGIMSGEALEMAKTEGMAGQDFILI
jgi:hypothetical protein